MKTKRADELVAVAHHEAGHAVIGRVLGLPCGSVTIIAQPEQDNLGHAVVADPIRTWQRGDGSRRALVEASVVCLYAGAEAERVILGSVGDIVGDGPDFWKARSLIELLGVRRAAFVGDDVWERYETRLRRKSNDLVREHRDKIERVARALIERETLEGNEVDALMDARSQT